MGKTLFQKVWEAHHITQLENGQSQILIALHLIHEVTSPQAFGMLRDLNLNVPFPERTFATVDHIIPTDSINRPLQDPLAEEMLSALAKNCEEFGIRYLGVDSGHQGVVHVTGPELGLTQPGMTIACGDSHTSTHGAFGAIAFGIGTTQVRDVLASQSMAMNPLKVRRVEINGNLGSGVTAKDVTLHVIRSLGVNGGTGYAYEYAGSTVEAFSMEERMTLCNMSIEGGARCGYVNPDQTTYDFLKGKEYVDNDHFEAQVKKWSAFASDPDANYDDIVKFNAADIKPTVTWGINPEQAIFVDEKVPSPDEVPSDKKESIIEALAYMKWEAGQNIAGTPIQVAFIGSCTNGRLSDFQTVAQLIKGHKVKDGIKALAVPGSQVVDAEAKKLGLDKIFIEAGFEWRLPGCSMCLAMNPDKLIGDQVCASSSNRNFKGRQGSPSGRTLLMSPIMVAAAAISGEVSDARKVFSI